MQVDRTRSQKALKFHCQDGTGVESPRKEQKADPRLAGMIFASGAGTQGSREDLEEAPSSQVK